MIPINDTIRNRLHILAAFLWIYIIAVSWSGSAYWGYTGYIAVTLIGIIYFILGTTLRGSIGVKIPLCYPILLMAVLWMIAFTGAWMTRGTPADTWILGLHPGQFWALLCFWIGTQVTAALSYALYFDTHVLPEETWHEFLEEVRQQKTMSEKEG